MINYGIRTIQCMYNNYVIEYYNYVIIIFNDIIIVNLIYSIIIVQHS